MVSRYLYIRLRTVRMSGSFWKQWIRRFYMRAETFLEMAGIPLLIFVICMYYGIRLVISKDISMIRGKGKAPVRDEKEYLEGAAKLMFFLGAAALLMAVLVFVNLYVATAEIIISTFIMGILWKRLEMKYGS